MMDVPSLLLDRVDSTLLEAERQHAAGRRGPLLICAGEQTGGVGRHGRAWASPPGNLYWTMLLDDDGARPPDAGLPFAAGLAVRDAAIALGVAANRLRLKWPNDVMLDGRKLAGVLVRVDRGEAAGAITVGIGMNVVTAPAGAVALAEPGVAPGLDAVRLAVTDAFLRRWEQWRQDGMAPLRDAVAACLHGVGEVTQVSLDRDRLDVLRGVVVGLDPAGALLLQLDDGTERVVLAGDVLV